MNGTAAPLPRGVSEMQATGVEAAPSRLVRPPRVAASPCALECKWLQTVRLTDVEGHALERYVVFGQAIGVYIDDRFIKNGRLDTAGMRPIARCGYDEYAMVETVFRMTRPPGCPPPGGGAHGPPRFSPYLRACLVSSPFRHDHHGQRSNALGLRLAAPHAQRGPRRRCKP